MWHAICNIVIVFIAEHFKNKLMKTLILLLAVTFGSTVVKNDNNSPLNTKPVKKALNISPLTDELTIIEEINFQMDKSDADTYLNNVIYNTTNENLTIAANRNITFLQLINEQGVIDFQLPVFAETVTIDLNDLNEGNWNLQIMVDSDTIIPATFSHY